MDEINEEFPPNMVTSPIPDLGRDRRRPSVGDIDTDDDAEDNLQIRLPRYLRSNSLGTDGEAVERTLSSKSLGSRFSLISRELVDLTQTEVQELQAIGGQVREPVESVADELPPSLSDFTSGLTPPSVPPQWWEGVKYIREAVFGLALGIATFPKALNTANRTFEVYEADTADKLALAGSLLSLANLLFYFPKVFLFWDEVAEVLDHPTASSAFGLCGMALMTMSDGFVPYSEPLSTITWYSGFFFYVVVSLHFLAQQRLRKFKEFKFASVRDQLVPLMIIPMVGIEVGTISGRSIARPHWVDDLCLYLGIIGGLTMHMAVMVRIFFGKPLPDDIFPTTFIMLAPKFLILAAWLTVHPHDHGGFIQFLFFFGIFSYLVNTRFLIRRLYKNGGWIPYTPAFAATTFPFAIATVGTFKVYEVLHYEWVKYLGALFLLHTTIHVGVVQLWYFHDYSIIFLHLTSRRNAVSASVEPLLTRYAENIYVQITTEDGDLTMVERTSNDRTVDSRLDRISSLSKKTRRGVPHSTSADRISVDRPQASAVSEAPRLENTNG